MRATIVTIGSEILAGDILNRNAQNFSKELNDMGFQVDKHISIDDDFDKIVTLIENEIKDHRLVLTTGGLGPTDDDITSQAVSKAISREMVLDEDSLDRLRQTFESMPQAMDNNKKQAYFPKGSTILENDNGTADGFFIEIDQSIIVVLPGPPKENIPMFKNYCQKLIENYSLDKRVSRYYRIYGTGEWEAELKIKDLVNGIDEVATFARAEGLFIKVSLKVKEYDDIEARFVSYETILRERFGQSFIGEGVVYPEKMLADLLMDRGLSVSTAESITGGMIASKIISIPGISSCIKESYVTYSDDTKCKILGVDKETIDKYGVVSQETVKEMLVGLKKISSSDLAIATSGYAGPGQGAGDVYYGALFNDEISIRHMNYKGNRNYIRSKTANDALINAYLLIRDN